MLNKNNNKGSNTRRASTVSYIRLIYSTIHIFYRYTKWTNGVSCAGIVASLPTCCIIGVRTFLILSPNDTTARLRQYGGIPVRPQSHSGVRNYYQPHTSPRKIFNAK
ncbi:MAG: hypothetical protein IKD19_07695 [Prevotella sp.]|nr:hypothetical protein [Prevotella sp.]